MAIIEDIREFADEIEQKFGVDANIAYAGVSMTQLSIARHYGGCKVQGKQFVYNPLDDSLIREDIVKWIAKRKKAAKS
jgi:phosphotransferase system IIB component